MFYTKWELKCFKVIYFGPKNFPIFYTVMMQFLGDKWSLLFYETNHFVVLNRLNRVIVCNNCIIIDVNVNINININVNINVNVNVNVFYYSTIKVLRILLT